MTTIDRRKGNPFCGKGFLLAMRVLWPRAAAHLVRVDPKLAPLVRRHGTPTFVAERNRFRALAEAILYQQLAGKAAATIAARVRGLYPGNRFPTAERLAATPILRLRSAGVSGPKARYMRGLAKAVASGGLDLRALGHETDGQVIEELVELDGIGRWTAEMFLIFSLGRQDVLSAGDYGVQKGMQKVYGLRRLPKPDRMRDISEPWRPYRSAGCWYMWRAVEDGGRAKA